MGVPGRLLGLALCPSFVVAEDIKKGSLTQVYADFAPPPVGMYALYPHNRHLAGKVRTYLDFLQGTFAKIEAL